MCGIAGIISKIPEYNHTDYLKLMLDTMLSRGPDLSEIEVIHPNGCIGHNRLSIIDLSSRAKQPMWDQSQRYCLCFNGEIYNYQEIRQELIKLGHHFKTTSDSEVLIEAWAEWGSESIKKLTGMFAFSVWDKINQQLFLIRDRIGEKPLYYAAINNNINNGIIFSSELKAIIKHPYFERRLSASALDHYLSYNYTSNQDSIFIGINKLPPAAYLLYDVSTHRLSIHEYWTLSSFFRQKLTISYEDAQHELDHLIAKSVREKMIADVPLGGFLSGGIDSTTIVSYMRGNKNINTFGVGFREKSYDELPISRQTANFFGFNHNECVVTPDIDHFTKMIEYFDEPFADTSLIPTYLLCAFAKKSVTVSLSGDGGDELFGGYSTYQANRLHRFVKYLPAHLIKGLNKVSRLIPTSFDKMSMDFKIKNFLRGCLLDPKCAHIGWREIFNESEKRILFRSNDSNLGLSNKNPIALKWFDDISDCHYLDQAMYVDIKTWLIDDILVKVDRSSMANSLEIRSPFLDHRIVEFAAKLPVNYKIKRHQGKAILKSSYKSRFPNDSINRSKKGFNSPISFWLSNEFYDMAYEMTTSNYLTNWFDRNFIDKLWYEHKNCVRDNGHRLFNLLCLSFWSKQYLN